MPNWCNNTLTLTATNDEQKAFLSEAFPKNTQVQMFQRLRPMPNDIFRGNLSEAEREIYGENNWYDWSVAHWGTKWDTDVVVPEDFDGVTLKVGFDTAWAAPIELYEYLVEQGFDVDAAYYEPGMNFGGIFQNEGHLEIDDLTDEILENTADGEHLDREFGILEEREQYDNDEEE